MAMKKNIFRWLVGFLIVAILILWAITFHVREGHVAVVTRLGEPRRIAVDAGLYFKWPAPIETARVIDTRQRVYNTRFGETLTRDKKNIILLTYVIWKVDVKNPLRFLQAVGTLEAAEAKLDGMISNAKNAVMGNYRLTSLVSTNPEKLKVDEIERSIFTEIAGPAREKLGVEILQLGFKRIALPEENVRYVFQQMRAERAQFAAQAIAEGRREAAAIRSEADVESARIVAEATEKAADIRSNAEKEAAKQYAEAQRKDPEFYEFLRSLDSLKKLLGQNATLMLRTDSAPFDLLRRGARNRQIAPQPTEKPRGPGRGQGKAGPGGKRKKAKNAQKEQ
jgi:membrane protease subunit HflC